MLTFNPKDAIHKAWLFRILGAFYENPKIAKNLYFKGGTCAAMLGYLDRFSIDLDFDYVGKIEKMENLKKKMEDIFRFLELEIKDQSRKIPQYFLKYKTKQGKRNTLKIDCTFPPIKANSYQPFSFSQIDRIIYCQTIETMFGNKLVALIDRYQKTEKIAGRDLYDINHFFLQGYSYNKKVIQERTNQELIDFFLDLKAFISQKVNQTIINQDLNMLLDYEKFKIIRKNLKNELIMLIENEIKKLQQD
ncbi:MAG: hypothetical protein GF335_00455 [Candidatus Moranbacteria bacterium]|nr:hypothetical protein [Candidatus Moranbacteria bacterium]